MHVSSNLPPALAPAAVQPAGAPETSAPAEGRQRADADERIDGTAADQVERLLVTRQLETQAQELAIDRIRKTFDLQEAERAELQREWNAMRDVAMEQIKHDDEILKKWIALI